MKLLIMLILCCSILLSGCMSTGITVIDEPINVTLNEYAGHQFNAWNNTLTGVNGRSNIIDTRNLPHISIIKQTSGQTTLSVFVSEDCSHFTICNELTTKINAPTGNSAHIFFTAGARCYQIESSANVYVNATIVAKP